MHCPLVCPVTSQPLRVQRCCGPALKLLNTGAMEAPATAGMMMKCPPPRLDSPSPAILLCLIGPPSTRSSIWRQRRLQRNLTGTIGSGSCHSRRFLFRQDRDLPSCTRGIGGELGRQRHIPTSSLDSIQVLPSKPILFMVQFRSLLTVVPWASHPPTAPRLVTCDAKLTITGDKSTEGTVARHLRTRAIFSFTLPLFDLFP
ncbi:hypothetical protein EDB81DRAFT_511706 [Dactylonectria macrodidyma]|uniref:Uncharacterized protein n=1 Tax=Dactylonectria macrodidyma TaxID=307937 RepID=A0A9P9ET58_9HYPO|nr:hypothetical protein EDB81DRAFT_511706 [Dactylonectria macrodidyma]